MRVKTGKRGIKVKTVKAEKVRSAPPVGALAAGGEDTVSARMKRAEANAESTAPAPVDVQEGSNRYMVRLLDGRKSNPLAVCLNADSKGEAKEKFFQLCGIVGTENKVQVDADPDESDLTLSENGIVTKGL